MAGRWQSSAILSVPSASSASRLFSPLRPLRQGTWSLAVRPCAFLKGSDLPAAHSHAMLQRAEDSLLIFVRLQLHVER